MQIPATQNLPTPALALILPVALVLSPWPWLSARDFRVAALRGLLTFACTAVLITELLSAFSSLRPIPMFLCWCTVTVVFIAVPICRRTSLIRWRWQYPPLQAKSIYIGAVVAIIGGMAGLILYIALLSPPNSADAMSYHLPRIVFWLQHQSVAFFPTPYLNQIMLQPVAEYLMLQTFVLSGGDHYVNLVQFTGYVASIIGVSSITAELRLRPTQQATAALFCATLPNAILQASGAKNDTLLAGWLVAAVLFAIRWERGRLTSDLVCLAAATGLALGTKGTAYLFLPPFLLAGILAARAIEGGREFGPLKAWIPLPLALAASAVLINGPQYARNLDLSGSILGFDSAQADGVFRWRNESLGWRPTLSNLIRNTSEQFGARRQAWNQAVYTTALSLHHRFGLDPNDPAATFYGATFHPPVNSNQEADANNRWHILFIVFAVGLAAIRRERQWLIFLIAPLGGFFLFCFYLKWQPFFSRLEIPLFIIAIPLAAAGPRHLLLQAAISLLLLSNCRLALVENWTRPLHTLRSTSRNDNYFNDMVQWNNRASYLEAVSRTAASDCRLIGLDINQNHVVYPYQALLRQHHPAVRFVNVGVINPSAKYASPDSPKPCAVFCPDCARIPAKTTQYGWIAPPQTIGEFLLFLPDDSGNSAKTR